MAKSRDIQLGDGSLIRILYEDRAVLAIDKPPGWMLAPASWDRTGRNLQRALESGLAGGDYWARCRNLKYLRFVHRLDADTSGLLLLARSPGALKAFQGLFESRRVEKIYWAVIQGLPREAEWVCRLALAPDPAEKGKVRAQSPRSKPSAAFKPAETRFRVLQTREDCALVEARPITGRTHQIRVHLAAAGHPVVGDALYGNVGPRKPSQSPGTPLRAANSSFSPLALRAVALAYPDPFTGKSVRLQAPVQEFAKAFGFTYHLDQPH